MFAPEALAHINESYAAHEASPEEAWAWACQHPWAIERVIAALKRCEPLSFLDGQLMTDKEMIDTYITCDRCFRYVQREPLTWGVTQYCVDTDLDQMLCNECYTEVAIERLKTEDGFNGWPVMAGDLSEEQFCLALNTRALDGALEADGWERVMERGVDGWGGDYDGLTPAKAMALVDDAMTAHPDCRYLVTCTTWQFCADFVLWRK